jgi:hypothetical protein
MPIEPQSNLDKIIDASSNLGFSVGAMSILGYVAHTLSADDPKVNTKRFVGGILLSAFVGWASVQFLTFTGMDANLAAPIASVMGASGNKGFEWLIDRMNRQQG